jgi:hypothetical protein
MSRKDYEAIAAIIKGARLYTSADDPVALIATALAAAFAQDNPRFDRARFLAACGVSL